jgi:hypothetical protein
LSGGNSNPSFFTFKPVECVAKLERSVGCAFFQHEEMYPVKALPMLQPVKKMREVS